MKFAVVIAFTLALAMGVQSSLLPLAHHHLALAGPLLLHGAHLHHAPHGPGSVAIHASALHPHLHAAALALDAHHLHDHAAHAHLAHAHLAHAHLADAHLAHAHLAHAHEGHYLAKNRGAVHSAPLPGHLASASSINLAPAPGTH